MWRALERMGYRVQLRDLRAPEGGVQALVAPMEGGGFSIWVDDRPSASEAAAGHPARSGRHGWLTQFRLAHEWGHTLFFTGTRLRRRSTCATESEEEFCDEFAYEVLGRPSD